MSYFLLRYSLSKIISNYNIKRDIVELIFSVFIYFFNFFASVESNLVFDIASRINLSTIFQAKLNLGKSEEVVSTFCGKHFLLVPMLHFEKLFPPVDLSRVENKKFLHISQKCKHFLRSMVKIYSAY